VKAGQELRKEIMIQHFRSLQLVVGLLIAGGLATPAVAAGAEGKAAPVTLALMGKDFAILGDWMLLNDFHHSVLYASPQGVKFPPVAAVVIPRAGRYRVWVAAKDFPNDRPGTRTFCVGIAGKRLETVFGKSGKDNYALEDGGWMELPAGPAMVTLEQGRPFARFLGLILTSDPQFSRSRPITAYVRAKQHTLPLPHSLARQQAALKIDSADAQAVLSNDRLRLEFLRAHRGELATLAMGVKLKTSEGWRAVDIDPAAEGYFVNVASGEAKMGFSGFYPTWTRSKLDPFTVEAGGVRVTTVAGRVTHSLVEMGDRTQFFPRSAVAEGNQVRVEFHPTPAGQLSAVWRLSAGQSFADVELSLIPVRDGQVSLGYEVFFRRDVSAVDELLLPMMYHRKRLPAGEVTLLSNTTPTPLALVQSGGGSAVSVAVVADPRDIAYEWPDGRRAPYAFSIRGPGATVQPAIYGPVIGTSGAAASKGQQVRMRCKVLVEQGDWYAAFRTTVDRIFGLTDYRENVRTSLSDAVYNMIELYLDDDHGGWWERAKGPYQIESKNSSTHSAPMLPLALYRLTNDSRLLDRRVLPTLAFMLSREGAHFSPVPDDSGHYSVGSMNGPVKMFGTATYAGLWELTGHRTPAFLEVASPAGEPRVTAGYSHGTAFYEYVARYQLSHDDRDLAKACELADAYIRAAITTPPHKDIGPQPFFFISFVPDWEGLLSLHEATGKQRYLEAAVFGARQLMTGLWSQPVIPRGKITVHSTGQYEDHPGLGWWKGPEHFRLGYPRRPNDTPAHEVPAWTVSNVGLGFEQPITFRSSGAGRLIWQMGFSAHFLRLYRYTHDQAFLTCARNAVVGRWSNYPGYYITGFTDLPQDPEYPIRGPDVTEFYYHHIGPHLAWSIDYLVSEAEMLSDGAIAFPSLRQFGYAYFDSRIFGHAPGKVYDDTEAWLLFRRGLVSVDNRQINTLLAWSKKKLHVILTNQSQQSQDVTLKAGEGFEMEPGVEPQVSLRVGNGAPVGLALEGDGQSVKVHVPARGLATVTVTGVKIEPPARPEYAPNPKAVAPLVLPGEPAATRAAAIQVEPGRWHAYVWSTASPRQARSARLHYQLGGQWRTLDKGDYPFEFLVPVASEREAVRFKLELTLPDEQTTSSPEGVLQVGAR
jgi:hypothetical protein